MHIALTAVGISVILWLVVFCCGSLMILLVPGHSCGENIISPEFNRVSAKRLLRCIFIAFCCLVLLSSAVILSWVL